jgi:hypothetical protein
MLRIGGTLKLNATVDRCDGCLKQHVVYRLG